MYGCKIVVSTGNLENLGNCVIYLDVVNQREIFQLRKYSVKSDQKIGDGSMNNTLIGRLKDEWFRDIREVITPHHQFGSVLRTFCFYNKLVSGILHYNSEESVFGCLRRESITMYQIFETLTVLNLIYTKTRVSSPTMTVLLLVNINSLWKYKYRI